MIVTVRPNSDNVEIPELNVSSSNFSILSQLLQLESDDYCGSITAELLAEKLILACDEMNHSAKEWIQSASEWFGSEGVHFIEMGLREEQILRYFERLDKIIAYAKQQNVDIVWS